MCAARMSTEYSTERRANGRYLKAGSIPLIRMLSELKRFRRASGPVPDNAQPEFGAFPSLLGELICKPHHSRLDGVINQSESFKSFEARLNVTTLDQLRDRRDCSMTSPHPDEDRRMVAMLA